MPEIRGLDQAQPGSTLTVLQSLRSYTMHLDRRACVHMPRSKAHDLLTGEAAFIHHGPRHTT